MDILRPFVLISTAALFLASCGQSGSAPSVKTPTASNAVVSAPPKADAPSDELATTADLYFKNCMICHKDTGKGGKTTIDGKSINPIDLTSAKLKARTDDKLLAQIKEGSPDDGMPGFKDKLTDDQIRLIIKHVRTLQQ